MKNIKGVEEVFSKSLQFNKGNNMNQIPNNAVEWKEAQLNQEIWIRIITQILCSWVALGRSRNLSGSKYLICKMHDVIS